MKTLKSERLTTISADPEAHMTLKHLAKKMGISQRRCLSLILEEKVHKDKIARKKKEEELDHLDVADAINLIYRRLERIEKRENPRDTIVAFFRTQEKDILRPILSKMELILAIQQEILEALKSIK